jgi:hypothetical protein
MTKEAMKLALEALEGLLKKTSGQAIYSFMETERRVAMSACVGLRQALANEALERMAENARELGLDYDAPVVTSDTSQERVDKTAKQQHEQQQREWVGLTDEEIIGIGNASSLKAKLTSTGIIIHPDGIKNFAQTIEAKLKEKNT